MDDMTEKAFFTANILTHHNNHITIIDGGSLEKENLLAMLIAEEWSPQCSDVRRIVFPGHDDFRSLHWDVSALSCHYFSF